MNTSFFILATALALAICSSSALACLHWRGPAKFEEGTKYVFLFHDGKNAHMVVKTELRVPEADQKAKLPSEIAWVLPLPSLPSSYEEIEPTVFLKMLDKLPGGSLGFGGKSKALSVPKKEILIHPPQVFGQYRIEPIEILKDGASKPFNEWLKKNGFNSMPEDLQKPYLNKGSVFLAIRAKISGKTAELKPLHITYSSDSLSYPLRFTHDNRTFNIEMFWFLPNVKAIGDTYYRLFQPFLRGVNKSVVNKEDPSESLGPSFWQLVAPQKSGYLVRFSGYKVNSKDRSLRDLKSDPSIPVKTASIGQGVDYDQKSPNGNFGIFQSK